MAADDERDVFFTALKEACSTATRMKCGYNVRVAMVDVLRREGRFAWRKEWLTSVKAPAALVTYLGDKGENDQKFLGVMPEAKRLVERESTRLLRGGKIARGWKLHDKANGFYRIAQIEERNAVNETTLMTLARNLRIDGDESIAELAHALRLSAKYPLGIGKFILEWHDPRCVGVDADLVRVEPHWNPASLPKEGAPCPPLEPLPAPVLEAMAPYLKRNEDNRPKAWLRKFEAPLTERRMTLQIGGMDWDQIQAIRSAYSMRVTYKGQTYDRGLRELFESGTLGLSEHWYGNVTAHVVMITSDNFLILAQRSRNIQDAGGSYSPSLEEGWNPAEEQTPDKAVLRGIWEEFKIREAPTSLKLVAVGREWGKFWNTGLVYVARMSVDHEAVLSSWVMNAPDDRNEAAGLSAVPIGTVAGRRALLDAIRVQRFLPERFAGSVAVGTGGAIGGEFHPSSGLLRLLVALCAMVGPTKVANELRALR